MLGATIRGMNASVATLPRPTGVAPIPVEPAIRLERVGKSYGSVEALREVDLQVDAGEVIAVLGPNGAGKTTAIGIMLGLRPPSSGGVTILGGEPGSRAVRSRIGAMLQDSGVPATLRVSEVIDLFRSYYPLAMPRDAVLAAAGLSEMSAKRVGALSDGTLQWTEGMLYPLLHRLERQGHIEGRWGEAESGRKRKYYRITRSGRAHLTDQRRQWQAVDEALRNVWRGLPRAAGPAGLVPATSGGD